MKKSENIEYYKGLTRVWDVAESSPRLWKQLLNDQPWVSKFRADLDISVPLAHKTESFDEDVFFKPNLHARALYKRVPDGGSGYIAFKGTELRAIDLDALLAMRRHVRVLFSNFTVNERFAIIEHIIPHAVLLDEEALVEANAAAQFQQKYIECFGRLAQIPAPIAVFRWSEEDTESFLDRLNPHLSQRANSLCSNYAKQGLGCVVYYHPSPEPTRILHVVGEIEKECAGCQNYTKRRESLNNHLEPKLFIDRYLTLVAEIISLGIFPVSVPGMENGHATDPQNVLISGGIVDVGSFHPMSQCKDSSEFYQTWLLLLSSLRRTIRTLFASTLIPTWDVHRQDDPLQGMISGYLWPEFVRKICDISGTNSLDSRLGTLLTPASLVDGIESSLEGLYQQPRSHLDNSTPSLYKV